MPHPAVFGAGVSAFEEHRESARDKAFQCVERAAEANQSGKVGLFNDIIAHLAEHHVAVVIMRAQTRLGLVLGAGPTPIGDVH